MKIATGRPADLLHVFLNRPCLKVIFNLEFVGGGVEPGIRIAKRVAMVRLDFTKLTIASLVVLYFLGTIVQ